MLRKVLWFSFTDNFSGTGFQSMTGHVQIGRTGKDSCYTEHCNDKDISFNTFI